MQSEKYVPKNKIRVVTAASLFDGHDASINIMRRIIQSSGAEVIHLGHDRSAQEVVDCAIQEDANHRQGEQNAAYRQVMSHCQCHAFFSSTTASDCLA